MAYLSHDGRSRMDERLRERLRRSLVDDVVPFWERHGVDGTHGGILTGLDRQGRLIESDKSIWFQGRATWVFAHLSRRDFGTNEDRGRWLETAEQILGFLTEHGVDPAEGRYRYRVTREGRPLVTRRYLFSDCFAALANAAVARTGSPQAPASLERARTIYRRVQWYRTNPERLEPKVDPETRPSRGFAMPMILLNVIQELRAADPEGEQEYCAAIDALLDEIGLFFDRTRRCIREQVAADGAFQDHFEGRLLNPGHAMEAAWFILEEARWRSSRPELAPLGSPESPGSPGLPGLPGSTSAGPPPKELTVMGTTILDWMWEWGWDREYGGVVYFRDADGHDSPEYWHDMKFWWPQCEAILASHYAHAATGDARYARWHEQAVDWTLAHFPDPEYGEWFGYLHRDGSVSSTLKGTLFKGPYHIPRMLLASLDLA